jgi:hypothetical protein
MKIQGKLTAAFGIEKGCRQDDVLSTPLFDIVLGKVIRNIETNPMAQFLTEQESI